MTKLFVVLVLLVAALLAPAQGLSCRQCTQARSFEECESRGSTQQCAEYEICHTEVGYHDDDDSMRVDRGCQPVTRCLTGAAHTINDTCITSPDGSCTCCCTSSDCGEGALCRQQKGFTSCDRDMLLDLENGEVSCTKLNKPGSNCEFTCDDGYILTGFSLTSCLHDGKWTDPKPSCTPFDLNNYMEYDMETTPSTFTNQDEATTTPQTGVVLPGGTSTCSQVVPTSVENGRVRCQLESSGVVSCKFECMPHSILVGRASVVNCSRSSDQDGQLEWEAPFPICAPVPDHCISKPIIFPHGSYKCRGSQLTESCSFECDHDYELIGPRTVTCSLVEGSFRASGKVPKCRALVANLCHPRPTSFATTLEARCHGSGYGETCTFTCRDGARLLGASTLFCIRRGRVHLEWDSNVPECRSDPKRDFNMDERCPPIELTTWSEHAGLRCTGGDVTDQREGDVCFLACDDGYRAAGDVTSVTCSRDPADGRLGWSRDPAEMRCEKRAAGSSCFPLYTHVENGLVTCKLDDVTGKETCSFECDENFSLHGSPRIVCNRRRDVTADDDVDKSGKVVETMTWSDQAPKCLPIHLNETMDEVAGISCLQLPAAFRHGSIKCLGSDDSEVCTFECQQDYYLVGVTVATCNRSTDGHVKWNADIPICSPFKPRTSCGEMDVKNGQHYCQGKGANETCVYECDEGFYASSPTTLRCVRDDYGQMHWDSQPPFCLPLVKETCKPSLEEFANGRVRCVGRGVGEVCEFTCDKSYRLLGQTTIRCMEGDRSSGRVATWSSPIPQCVIPLSDEEPMCVTEIEAPSNGRVLCECGPHRVGSVCLVACNHGYRLVGEGQAVCELGARKVAQWSNTRTECRLASDEGLCPVQKMPNADVVCSNGNEARSECRFRCHANHTMVPPTFVSNVCQPDGTYDSFPTCCDPICPPAVPGDMLILLDASSSRDLDIFVRIVRRLMRSVMIGEDQLRVGILPFASRASAKSFIDFSTDSQHLNDQLTTIRTLRGESLVEEALDEVPRYFDNLAPRLTGKVPQPRSLLVLSNDEADNMRMRSITSAAQRIEANHHKIEMMAFGFGRGVEATLRQISGQGSYAVLGQWQDEERWTAQVLDVVGRRMCRSRACPDVHGGVVLTRP